MVEEERLVKRSIWAQAIVQGSYESMQFYRSLPQQFAGESPIMVVSVDNRRSRSHRQHQGELALPLSYLLHPRIHHSIFPESAGVEPPQHMPAVAAPVIP